MTKASSPKVPTASPQDSKPNHSLLRETRHSIHVLMAITAHQNKADCWLTRLYTFIYGAKKLLADSNQSLKHYSTFKLSYLYQYVRTYLLNSSSMDRNLLTIGSVI